MYSFMYLSRARLFAHSRHCLCVHRVRMAKLAYSIFFSFIFSCFIFGIHFLSISLSSLSQSTLFNCVCVSVVTNEGNGISLAQCQMLFYLIVNTFFFISYDRHLDGTVIWMDLSLSLSASFCQLKSLCACLSARLCIPCRRSTTLHSTVWRI